jgi:hypothetical protein
VDPQGKVIAEGLRGSKLKKNWEKYYNKITYSVKVKPVNQPACF